MFKVQININNNIYLYKYMHLLIVLPDFLDLDRRLQFIQKVLVEQEKAG